MQIKQLIEKMPKIDLHRHLEVTARSRNFQELVQSNSVFLLPHQPGKQLTFFHSIDDYKEYAGNWEQSGKVFLDKEAFASITAETVKDANNDNVRYLELRFDPARDLFTGMDWKDVVDALAEGIEYGKRETGIDLALICGLNDLSDPAMAEKVINFAITNIDKGIVGLDVPGEGLLGHKPMVQALDRAVTADLGITLHIGDRVVPRDLLKTIEALGIRRISHGSRSLFNEELIEYI